MRIDKTSRKIKEGRIVATIRYYSDAGREIAFFDGADDALYFNSDTLKHIDNRPDFISHAKDEYKADLETIALLHPNAPRGEYMSA